MRCGAALLTLLLAVPAFAQTAPVTSATPVVVRACWIEFPAPTCAPRVRVAVESPVLTPNPANPPAFGPVSAEQDRPDLRVYPLRHLWALASGDEGLVKPLYGGPTSFWVSEARLVGSAVGLAPRPLRGDEQRAKFALGGTWSSINRFNLRLTATWGETMAGGVFLISEWGVERGNRGGWELNRQDPYLFVAVVPASEAARRPLRAIDSWRAHAREALTWTWPFFQFGQDINWEKFEESRLGSEAALAFLALAADRSEQTRAAIRRSFPNRPSAAEAALALADDPSAQVLPGGVGRARFAYLKQIVVQTEHSQLRAKARANLERVFGERAVTTDPLLRERLGISRPGVIAPVWLFVMCVLASVVRIVRWRPDEDPLHGVRRRLAWGGFLVWADPVYLGIDLLPDALGYLALVVAGRRLLAEEQAWYPRFAQCALIVGAVLAVAVTHTPVPGGTAAVAGVALTAYGLGFCLGLARYLDEADKAWSAQATRAAAGLILLALPLELVLAAAGGTDQLDAKVPAMFQAAVYPGLLLIRVGLPALLWAVVMALRPELHAAAQARKAEAEIPALELERTPPPEYEPG